MEDINSKKQNMKKFILSFIIIFTSNIYGSDMFVFDIDTGYWNWSSNATVKIKKRLSAKRTLRSGYILFAENERCKLTSISNIKVSDENLNIPAIIVNDREIQFWLTGSSLYSLICKITLNPSDVKVSDVNNWINNLGLKIVVEE